MENKKAPQFLTAFQMLIRFGSQSLQDQKREEDQFEQSYESCVFNLQSQNEETDFGEPHESCVFNWQSSNNETECCKECSRINPQIISRRKSETNSLFDTEEFHKECSQRRFNSEFDKGFSREENKYTLQFKFVQGDGLGFAGCQQFI